MHIEKGNTHNNDVIVLNFIFFLCLICFDLDILNLPCTLTNHLMLCPRLHKVISTFYVDQSSFNYLFFLKNLLSSVNLNPPAKHNLKLYDSKYDVFVCSVAPGDV